MKGSLRVLPLCLICFMLMNLCLVGSSASAAEGGGLTFSATDLYAPVKSLDEAPNTFEAWINMPTGTSGQRSRILSNNSSGTRMILFDVLTKGRPAIIITEGEGEKANFIFQNVNVCTGQWLHLAIVRDPSALTLSCYVNGELKETIPVDGNIWNDDLIPGAPLCLGGDWHTDNASYCRGSIREVAVFSTTRTATEVVSDMNSPMGAEGLLVHYDLTNAQKGDNIPDLSGNGYNIVYRENKAWLKPNEVEPVTDYAYSFAVIGDMQELNYQFPDKVSTMFDWIADNAESKKIQYVFGLGDITDTDGSDEWERAKTAFHSLDGKVNYSIVRGNHDATKGDYTKYIENFPWDDFKDTHDGSFDGTMLNTFRLFEVGDVKYLFLNLDFGPADEVLAWAGELCEQYPDRNVIISTHAYLYINENPITKDDHVPPVGNNGYNNGDDMWEKFVSQHENISLVLCGHEAGNRIIAAQDRGINGNAVTSLLVNTSTVEASTESGLGMVAMLYFSEDGKNVQVRYYSTVTDQYFRSINQFAFNLEPVENTDRVPGSSAPEYGGNIYNKGKVNILGGTIHGGAANYGGNIYNEGKLYVVSGAVFKGIANYGRNIFDAVVNKLSAYHSIKFIDSVA